MKNANLTSRFRVFNFFVIALFLFSIPFAGVYAACCAGHGGVASCNKSTGFQQCKDGTASPTCTCAIPKTTKKTKATTTKVTKSKTTVNTAPATTTVKTKQKATVKTVPKTTTTTTGTMGTKGCCSRHGGIAQCNKSTGFQTCKDGTASPTCKCQ